MERYNFISVILHIVLVTKSSIIHLINFIKYILSLFESDKKTFFKLDGFEPYNDTFYVNFNLKYSSKLNKSLELKKLYADKSLLERFSKDDMIKIFYMNEIVRIQNEEGKK